MPILHIPLGAGAAPIKKINIFADGAQSKDITLSDMGTDSTTAKLSIQTGVTLANTSMLVDGRASGLSYPSNISIDVGGDGDRDWQWAGLGYGGLGHQNLFILDGKAQNTSANLTITGGGGNNDTASIRLPYGAQVTNATLVVEVKGISIAIECKTGSRACDTVNNDPVYSLRDAFNEKGWISKIVTGTDIDTVGELSQYTVVLLGNPGYSTDSDHTVYQSALRTWVTTYGGGMIGTGWLLYATTAGSDMEYLLPVNTPYTSSSGGQVTITNGNHPVTQGVNSFNVPASAYCERPSSNTVDAGATSLATCGGGPAVVVSDKGAGRTIYIGPNYFGDFQIYQSKQWYADANGKKLIQQATLWASGGGSLSGFIDIANDTNKEWSKTGFNGTEGLPDFSSTLNTFMATAQPSFTDPYGNQFVDVPIRVNSTSAGLISLRNLTVTYAYTAKVDQNPHNQTLAGEINGLIPTNLGTKNVTLPIVVSSDTAGIVTLHNFNADLINPAHAPLITAYEPAKDIVDANENTTVDLKVTATDWYRYPMTYTWFKDEKKNTTGDTYHYYIDFESQGQHNITVVVNNTVQDTARSWTVKVTNVDRPPHIFSYTPDLQVSMDENTTKTFSIVAKDPDIGDMVGYGWTLDGGPATSTSSSYDYKPTFLDQGVHYLEVTAKNQRQLKATLKWAITVNDVNAPPEITSWAPKTDPTMAENTTAMFSIKARTPDGDQLTYAWYVDDKPVPKETGTAFKFAAGFEDAGVREVKAEVSDGTLSVSHKWAVTVTDVNRPPVAVIASPKDDDEFLTTDNITLSAKGSTDLDKDKLTFEWYEGPMKIGTGETIKAKLPMGHQTVELRVSDGREGLTTTEVSIVVRALRFELTVDTGGSAPRAGDSVKIKVLVKSTGDADGTNIPVVLYIDGVVAGNQTIPTIASGDETTLEYTWTAKEGTHTVKVVMAQDKAEKSVSVQPPLLPITPGVKGNNWFLPLLLIIIVIAVFLTVVGVAVAKRKKRAAAAQVQPAVAPAPPVAAPVAQPMVQQPPPSAGSYRMVAPPTSQPTQVYAQPAYQSFSGVYAQPAYPPPPSSYYQARATVVATPPMGVARPVMPEQYYEAPPVLPEQPSVTSEAGADIEAELQSADAAIQEAVAAGKDVTRAKNHLRLANFFARKGDSPKAMDYCKKAREAAK